jgi:hypothetical protein
VNLFNDLTYIICFLIAKIVSLIVKRTTPYQFWIKHYLSVLNGGTERMKNWFKLCIVVVVISTSLLILPASGGIFTIPQGGTVFIGEQGLDISQTGANSSARIGWFGNGGNVITDAPTATVTVDDVKNFYVVPATFASKTGPWYTMPDKKLAFYVEDPSLNLRVFDDSSNFEVTNSTRWLPKGDQASFRIETNLVAMLNRPGISMVPVTIYVVQPDGSQLQAVSGYPLSNIGVTTSPFSTGPVWDTRSYPSGTYTVWAKCNVNGMNDNYRIDGKTQTQQTGNVQIQSSNPLITTSVTSTATTAAGTTPTTAVPATQSQTVLTTTPPATTQQPTSLPTTVPTTKSPGPEFVLVVAGLVGAALIIGKSASR